MLESQHASNCAISVVRTVQAAAAYPLLAADLVGGSCSPAAQTQQLSSWQHQLRSQQQLECQRYQQRLRQPAMRARETEFHGLRVPPISIAAYLRRIAQYAKCSPVCFVMAHSYIERLAKVQQPPMAPPCIVSHHPEAQLMTVYLANNCTKDPARVWSTEGGR